MVPPEEDRCVFPPAAPAPAADMDMVLPHGIPPPAPPAVVTLPPGVEAENRLARKKELRADFVQGVVVVAVVVAGCGWGCVVPIPYIEGCR